MTARSPIQAHWLLIAVVLLSALAFWTFPAFTTVDGATHAYTARMILDRWAGHPDPNTDLNSYWVPNALGHYALLALQVVLSPELAERVLVFLLLLGPGLGMVRLCRSMGRSDPWPILFVLPFCYSFLLLMGFFNFLLGMTLGLFLLAFDVRRAPLNRRHAIIFVLASLVVLWSHAMAFFFVALVHSILGLARFLNERGGTSTGARWREVLGTSVLILPGALLFLLFTGEQSTQWGDISLMTNLYDLKNIRSLLLYSFIQENAFNAVIGALLAVFLIKGAWDRLASKAPFGTPGDALLISVVVLLVLYFLVPDSTGYASYITQRLQLMMAFLLIAWIAVVTSSDRWSFALLMVLLAAHGLRINYISDLMAPFRHQRLAMAEASRALSLGATVLPINFEPEWLKGHQGAELGLYNEVHVLDNYECSMGYFPLVWRKDLPSPLYWHLMTATDKQCFEWLQDYVDAKETPAMDQIALIGPVDSASCKARNVLPILAAHYQQTFDNGYVQVFTLKR